MVKLLSYRYPCIISFISASGGVGKTKLALLLTYYLKKQKGRNVLFVDLDPTAGASFSVFDDDVLEAHISNNRTFSAMINHKDRGRNIDFSDYKVRARIQDIIVDFVIPGDDLIDIIERYWKSGSAGPIFRDTLEQTVPFERYHFIIIDTAPFFDPRYTTLSIYLSDYFVIPVTPNIVDIRRNINMLRRIKRDIKIALRFRGISMNLESFMKERILCVLNKVSPNPRQVEFLFSELFVQKYILNKEIRIKASVSTQKKIDKLISYAQMLNEITSFIPTYIKTSDAIIGRFPREAKAESAVEHARGFLEGIYEKITS